MADLNYSSVAVETELSGTIDGTTTTIQVQATTGFPQNYPFKLILDPDTTVEEVVYVQSIVGLQLDVLRGKDGTPGIAHEVGAKVIHGATGDDFQRAADHQIATSAHGATGAVVGTTNAQTLTNKTIVGSQNTLTNIAQSSVTNLATDLGALDTRADAADAHIAATAAHGATGAVVGTSNAQTFSNKTISGAINTLSNIAQSSLVRAIFMKSSSSNIANNVIGVGTEFTSTYDVVDFEVGGSFAATGGSTAQFQVPASGLYKYTLSVTIDGAATGNAFYLELRGGQTVGGGGSDAASGSTVVRKRVGTNDNAGAESTYQLNAVVQLTAGTVYGNCILNNTSESITVMPLSSENYFSLVYLGPTT